MTVIVAVKQTPPENNNYPNGLHRRGCLECRLDTLFVEKTADFPRHKYYKLTYIYIDFY